jgi:hypothetical protein
MLIIIDYIDKVAKCAEDGHFHFPWWFMILLYVHFVGVAC